ncbi:hypothetical protein CTEN210_01999 [Chaetoceros tenuissimus]|uniref:Sugar-phosphatase n=1 Tax=Chaetoceros tenuissimus TaxID=426638 RepID=A0AAD3CJ06_9STRA|nr:hypothetical protein CTEN210_01999 [Chaetoceros tenuissimus]
MKLHHVTLFSAQVYMSTSFSWNYSRNRPCNNVLHRQRQPSLFSSSSSDDMSEEERQRFDEIASQFLNTESDENVESDFPSAFPLNPFRSTLKKGGKDSLYSDEELFSVLTIHEELSAVEVDTSGSQNVSNEVDDNPLGGIHELVTKTLEIESMTSLSSKGFSMSSKMSSSVELPSELKERSKQIRAIASDVDGTILTKHMSIHPRTRLALIRAIDSANKYKDAAAKNESGDKLLKHFFPATGKSRKGCLDSLGIEVGSLIEENCGGVFLQGLFCVDSEGNVVFEKKLDQRAIEAAEALVRENDISIVAYDGDDLYTTNQSEIVVHLHEHYGEPLPRLLPKDVDDTVKELASHEPSMHKLLLMDDDIDKLTNVVRPKLEALADEFDACVTQALPTMLELLPKGCSKALGVQKLCEAIGIDPSSEMLALGDAENDAGMLDLALIGVAVGNASPPAREAADFIIDYTNDEGGAGHAIEAFIDHIE